MSTTKLHHPPVGVQSAESLRIHSLAVRDCCLRPSGLCVAGDFLPRCWTCCGSSLCAWCQAGFRTRGGKAAATRLSVNGGGFVSRAVETRRLEAAVVPCVGRLWPRHRASSTTAWDSGQVFSESFWLFSNGDSQCAGGASTCFVSGKAPLQARRLWDQTRVRSWSCSISSYSRSAQKCTLTFCDWLCDLCGL